MQAKKTVIFALVASVASMIFVAYMGAINASAQASNTSSSSKTPAPGISQTTVILPPQAVIELEGKTIPANDFIPLYDTAPYMIKSGHIDAKLPCDASSTSPLKILVGQVPNLIPANLTLIKPLSTPGKMCFYQADVVSQPYTHGDWLCITDIAIRNPTGTTMTFPPTSSVDIGADQIASGAGMAAGTSMTTTK